MPREILIDWTTHAGNRFRSVMYFDRGISVASQRGALETWLDNMAGALDNNCQYSIETAGREVDNATGALTGVWTDATVRGGVGSVVGECVADSTQVLVTWNTGTIAGGRFLRGRTFIPMLSNAQMVSGNTSAILRSTWDAHHTAFLAANVGFQVWHRPVDKAGGVVALAGTGTTGLELAVLRRRRG